MSAHAVHARYVTHVARSTERATPVRLAQYLSNYRANGRGAWPRQKVIARRLGVSVRTVQRWIGQLEAAGLLAVERHKPHHDHITGHWRRRSNHYRCTFQKSKRPRQAQKDLLTPRRQECHVIGLFEEPMSGSAPELVVPPPWMVAGMTAAEWTRHTFPAAV